MPSHLRVVNPLSHERSEQEATTFLAAFKARIGFDHGAGHSLLLLYAAKAPYSQKSKDFNGLVHYLSNILYKFILN